MRLFRTLIPALLVLALLVPLPSAPASAAVSIGISVGFAPPPLPVYDQPPLPGPGYMWMPGYWAWGPDGYYWVPGTWVLPPGIGLYWTPPWWGWSGAAYVFHPGYWGPRVGFYGGINYGFGYFGTGYVGGYWDRGRFFYHRQLNNFGNRHIPWTYDRHVDRREHNGVGWNGGVGGMPGAPSAHERAADRGRHWKPPQPQVQHFDSARRVPGLRSNTNQGNPPFAVTPRAGRFNDTGAVIRSPRGQQAPRAVQPQQRRQPKGR